MFITDQKKKKISVIDCWDEWSKCAHHDAAQHGPGLQKRDDNWNIPNSGCKVVALGWSLDGSYQRISKHATFSSKHSDVVYLHGHTEMRALRLWGSAVLINLKRSTKLPTLVCFLYPKKEIVQQNKFFRNHLFHRIRASDRYIIQRD